VGSVFRQRFAEGRAQRRVRGEQRCGGDQQAEQGAREAGACDVCGEEDAGMAR
jgi:hypothetical protein